MNASKATLAVAFATFVVGGVLGVIAVPVAKSILPQSWKTALRVGTSKPDPRRPTSTILHSVAASFVEAPTRDGYGAIEVIRDRLIFADRGGQLWWVSSEREFIPMSSTIDANPDEFKVSKEAQRQLAGLPGYFEGVSRRFGVKDLLAIPRKEGLYDLLASYLYWSESDKCASVRIDRASVRTMPDATLVASDEWDRLFESQPCIGLREDGQAIMAEEAGGRMIELSDREVLVTLGDLGHTGIISGSADAQRDDTHYGKMILIDLNTRDWRAYTKGHRNPQGLARALDGSIYSTEHGPNGGDELNLIVEGGNYGWPLVSYGRTCNDVNECTDTDGLYLRNPLNQHLGSHEGFIRPLMSWLPSIGISNLVVLKGTQFTNWAGDLLISSLKAQTLYRVRLDEGRAVYAEPVFSAGRRIRDVVEMNDGTIALKTESGPLIFLSAKVSRTESIVATCAGCHSFLEGQASALGPNLWGIVGREVATRDDFPYSDALSRVEGSWTKQSLREFLLDPQAYAPGTSMQPVTMTNEDADAIIEFLANLTD